MRNLRASILLVLTAALSLVLARTTRRPTPAIYPSGETLAVWG